MIAIINKGKIRGPGQQRRYHVYINHDLICKFTHNREEGLAACLEKAAKAAKKAEKEER